MPHPSHPALHVDDVRNAPLAEAGRGEKCR
jgi:hypothetical protein